MTSPVPRMGSSTTPGVFLIVSQSFLDIENIEDYHNWLTNTVTAAIYGDTLGYVSGVGLLCAL